jgi:hypothetical protein
MLRNLSKALLTHFWQFNMKEFVVKNIVTMTAAVACALALTACGGGGDSTDTSSASTGSGGSTTTGGTGTNGTGGSSTSNHNAPTFQYVAVQAPPGGFDQAGFLATLNQQGAQGYAYVTSGTFNDPQVVNGVTVTTSTSLTFVKSSTASSYTYEMLLQPSDITGLISQANAEGAKGYYYQGGYTFSSTLYSLYVKAGDSSATYTYIADLAVSDTNAFLAQIDQQGLSGYRFWGIQFSSGTTSTQPSQTGSNLYVKDNTSSATYTYDALPDPSTVADLLTQFNSEGAKGYYAAKYEMTIGNQAMWLYYKDQTQTTTFNYQSDAAPTTSSALINQANGYGAQGYEYWVRVTPSGGNPALIYYKGSNW